MIRSTSARTFERVKIWRGASLISGMILSSLMRLLPSRTMRLITGFSRTVMTRLPVSAPVIDDVGEQFGRVEVLQRLYRASRRYRPGPGELGIGSDRLRLEPLGAAHGDRADRARRRAAGAARAAAGAGCTRRPAAAARCVLGQDAEPPSRRGWFRPGASRQSRLLIFFVAGNHASPPFAERAALGAATPSDVRPPCPNRLANQAPKPVPQAERRQDR